MSNPAGTVEEVDVADVLELRRRVLPDGTPSDEPGFEGDDDPTTAHLVVRDDNGAVVATFDVDRPPVSGRPDVVTVQLPSWRWAATSRATGWAACSSPPGRTGTARGARLMWANARDTALGFYAAHGFEVVGDGFVTTDSALPHHRVVRPL